MHIKEIVIQGFKSFKDQVFVESFSPHHNVIVGRNGSGKSNFFFAIQFVLSDSYTRPEERVALLHEGSGVAVMSAYVEIKFDNSEGRFPIEKDEVVLRRTIGLKKDDFFVDNKHMTKAEVNNLLESAGFSRSNPYYIVRQGKVNALTLMKDNERLELLKEVAGTKVYDEKKEESLKIIEDTNSKLEQADELLVVIETRLRELEGEKEELKQYQIYDRDRRCLEFTIYDRDLQETNEKILELEALRAAEAKSTGDLHSQSVVAQDSFLDKSNRLVEAQDGLEVLRREKDTVLRERQENLKTRTVVDLVVQDFHHKHLANEKTRKATEKELKALNAEVVTKEEELRTVLQPAFEEALQREQEVVGRLKEIETGLAGLYAKVGRTAQFKSVDERDKWIRKELKDLQGSTTNKEKVLDDLVDSLTKLEKDFADRTARRAELEASIADNKNRIEDLLQTIEAKKQSREEANNRRKEFWKASAEMDHRVEAVTARREGSIRSMQDSISRTLRSGIHAVQEVVRDLGISGVYGTVIELFTIDDRWATAAEVTAGNGLFNLVVDTDETAAIILEELNRRKGGRVTFMPLNRLDVPGGPALPRNDDVQPLIGEVHCDPVVLPAMQIVFGRTLICRDLSVAADYSRAHDVNCITIEGDQVNRKGAFTGGFIDKRTSRLAAMAAIKAADEEIRGLEDHRMKVKDQVALADQVATTLLGELETAQAEADTCRRIYEQEKIELRTLVKETGSMGDLVVEKRKLVEELQRSVKDNKDTMARLQAELGTDLQSQLSPAEQDELAALVQEETIVKKLLLDRASERTAAEERATQVKTLLSENLVKRKAELEDALDTIHIESTATSKAARERELRSLDESIQLADKRLTELDKTMDEVQQSIEGLANDLDEIRSMENNQTRELQEEKKKIEKLLNKRSVLLQKKEEDLRKIRELGSLPMDATAKFKNDNMTKLMKKLHDVNENLKKYSHVNKKALDQYVTFSEQRDSLQLRKKELDSNGEHIKGLIDILDQRKDEAISRTFKGVAKAFSDVFKQLVPTGSASLVMIKGPGAGKGSSKGAGKRAATDEDNDDDDDDDHNGEDDGGGVENRSGNSKGSGRGAGSGGASKLDTYTGVAMKVSFTGEDTYLMHQLSGGQKSLVALALIFAIQRTMAGGVADASDPAPFYLFDEIDSALDAAHRTAVANLIHSQSQYAQFITTTFRPEFLQNANNYYLIAYNKQTKVSNINKIDREDAEAFILDTMREEAAGPHQP